MLVTLANDSSYMVQLAATAKPTVGVPNGRVLLEVDTATWFVFFNGTWYAQ